MAHVSGSVDSRFEAVADALAANLDAGVELGAGLYVDIGGQPVVDIWGGWTDRERNRPWAEDTIVNVWSSSKMIASMAVLMLVAAGKIDVFAPVAEYWPEFARNGKQMVQVRHLLSHTSGVSAWAQPFKLEDTYDLGTSTARLADQEPWWEPGSAAAYHASTFGHLNGELVRRVSGRTLGQFVRDELALPLDADFHIGVLDKDFARCATVYAPVVRDMAASLPHGNAPPDPNSVFAKTLAGSIAEIEPANTPAWRRAEIGATNGHGNAKALVRILSAVTLGGVSNGARLLDAPTIELIFQEQASGMDMFLNIPLRWGIGFALTPSGGVPFVRDGKVCFWGGWGGSMAIMDLIRGMTIGYAMNQMQPGTIGSDVAATYCDVIYRCADGR
jgi:CubicO group peptidase (beta-lactamase class C family)